MQLEPKRKPINPLLIKGQLIAGLISGFLVSPLNVVFDKSVILYSNGDGQLKALAKSELSTLTKTPFYFIKACFFRYMYSVYACTYTSSNLMDHYNFSESIAHPIQKLGVVFLVNTVFSLIKDKKYAEQLKKIKVKKLPLPSSSLSLFFVRDLISMASAFTIPPLLGKYISDKTGITQKNGVRTSQIICPLTIQLIATPIHLYALSIYDEPNWSFSQRAINIRGLFINALLMRMMRFLHTYGLGGIANMELRQLFLFKQKAIIQS